MSDGWRQTTLGQCVRFISGGTPSKSNPHYWGGSIPWISAKDMKTHVLHTAEDFITPAAVNDGAKTVPPGIPLLLVRGMTLHNDVPIVVCTQPASFNQDVKAVVAKEGVEQAVVPYLLLTLKPKLLASVDSASHGTGRLRSETLESLAVSLPPPGVQRELGRFFRSIDDKIDLNRRTNETLEAMARAVFKSWFVDFDPVHAKAAGKAPAHMDAETAALFPDTFGEDGLPVGWRAEAIGEHFKAMKGLSYKGSGLSDSGTPLFNLNSILEGGGYKYDGIKFYAGEFKAKHEAGPGDLLVANTEQGFDHLLIGFSTLVPPSQGKGIFSHHLYKVQARPKTHLNTTYLHFLLSASPQGEAIRRYSNGTTVNMLPADAFERPRIIVPPASLVATFSKFAMPIAEKQDAAVAENQTLAALRDLLLPKLMSGELRLRDAEKIVEGAA